MVQRIPIHIKRLLSIFMILVLLTPNVYCLENTEASQDVSSEGSQVDSESYEENNENIVESEEETSETISDLDSENADDDTETVSEDTMLIATTASGDYVDIFEDTKAYLSPTLENENDYFDTSLFTGSFVYSYPIETLKGRAGLEPEVSLTYSSAMGSKGTYGSLGMGWSLNENCIIRDTRYTPENTNDDRFILVLDGSTYKLVYVESDNSYHTETESFIKIEKSTTSSNSFGDYWILKMPDGTKYRFGYNSDSEQRNSVESRNYVSKWWLDLIEDVNGNQIKYTYLENPVSGEVGSTYLDSITYNDNHAVIDFEFTEKPQTFNLYENGNKILEKSLISSITVTNDGSTLWIYNLEYQNTNSKSFLTSISKHGLNGQSLPSVNFEYSTISGWESTGTWNPPTVFSYDGTDRGVRLADVNGDGLVDIIKGYGSSSGSTYAAWINTGSGWASTSTWNPPTIFSYQGTDRGVRLADVNGDGLVDIIKGYGSSSSSTYAAWINTGSGWASTGTWNPPTVFSYQGTDRGVRLADVNGDGLVDIIKGYGSSSGSTYAAWINTGSGWASTSTWNPPTVFSYQGMDRGVRLTDVNGDGLIDIITGYGSSSGSTYAAWINTGSGWASTSTWNPPTIFSYQGTDRGVLLADVNGDGLVDIITGYGSSSGYTYAAWINTGSGWASTSTWNPPTIFSYQGTDRGTYLADVNGDGLVDIITGYGSSSGYTYAAWINTNKDSPTLEYKTPYLLKEIHHSSGANTTIKYVPSTIFDNTGNDNTPDLPFSVWVTSSVTRDNGITGTGSVVSTTDYTYKNGMQYFDPPEEIEFRGFGEVTVENEYSIVKHFFHQDDVLKGIEHHTEVRDKNGNLYSSSDTEYTAQEIYPDVNLILLDSESKTQFDGLVQNPTSSAGWSSFIEYDEYDDYGNPLSITDYGDVNTTGDGKYYHFEYVNAVNPWILGKKTHEWVEDSDHVKKSESWYYYDETNDNSAISKGQLTKTVSWNNMGDNPNVLYDYDAYGNIIRITNPEGISKNIGYDANHLYPVSIENSLGQKERYEFNDLGRITKITDSNSVSTEYAYDDLHRITKVLKVNDTTDSPSTEYTYYQDGVAPEKILTKTKDYGSEANNYVINGSIFSNYKRITISPSSDGTLTDYQVKLNINYESEMQSDFDDLRFVDENSILLPYWIEEKVDSSYAKVWVKVPVIDGIDGATIKMYYGNSYVSSAENGDDVFEFFDDFESGVIDSDKWNEVGSPTIVDDDGDRVLKLTPNNHVNTFNKFSGTEYVVGGLMKFSSFGDYGPRMSLDVKHFSYFIESYADGTGWSGTAILHNPGSGSLITVAQARPSWSTGVWNRFSFSSTNSVQKLTSDKLNLSGTYANNLSGSIYITTWDSGNDVRFSYLYVRKFASSEPAVVVEDNDPSFNNYKTITISPSSDGTLTDYQVKLDINYESEMQSDFDDLRFVDENGILLPYWIEEKVDSSYAKVWVKVPVIDGIDGATIKMYYGNSYVSSAENGNDVFEFFDDFESGVIDSDKWNEVGSPTIVDDGGDKVLKVTPNNGVNTINKFSGTEYIVEGLMKFSSFGNYGPRMAFDVRRLNYQAAHFLYTIESYADGTGWSGTSISYYPESGSLVTVAQARPSWSTGVWNRLSFTSTNGEQGLTVNDFVMSGTYANNLSGSINICTWDSGNDIRFSYLYIRKFASSEPTVVLEEKNYVSTFDSTDSYDGFGQLIQKKYEGEDGWIIQNTAYNELGLVESVEVPHYSEQSGLSVTYEYDATGRPTVITNTDGTTLTYDYELDDTTITNQNGVDKTLTSDVFGNIVRVHEFNEGETYVTSYSYDALNNLIEITPGFNDPQAPPSVYFTYDSLGRKVVMDDPDMGSWTYEYDLNGNLINQTDSRGVSTTLSYDDLDRVTAIDYPNDEDVSFTYDLEFNGTLSRVTKGSASSSYDYDLRYRVESETLTIDGTPYTTSYDYDSMDRVTGITYPNGEAVSLTYNAQTLLESVDGVIDDLEYNARNQITRKEYSNGVITTYTYDSQKLLLDRIYSAGLQDLNYDFDNVGNVLEIADNTQNSVKTYGYDDLDRLVSADMSVNSVPTYQRDFTYDRYGSIRQVDNNGVTISSYGYSATPSHAPATYNGNTLDYDANGNLVDDEDFIYVYNDANQLSEVRYSANNSLVEKYWYDASGQRIKKQNSGGEFTYYINKFYEIDNGTSTSYFFRDDERVAKQTSESMEWYLSDHIGSTSLMVDENGLEIERTDYFPYGQVRSGGLEKYGFTGQENDADTGLMYYGARYYSPEYRVFVQPDTMLPDPYNPQALNRYSYVLNNPVKYTDPSGHIPVDTLLDGAFLAYDGIKYSLDPSEENLRNLEWSAASTALPYVPGRYVKPVLKYAPNIVKNSLKFADEGIEVAEATVEAEKVVSNVVDTLKASDNVPESLMAGEANTYVYYGVRDGDNVYVGITNNLEIRKIQHQARFEELIALNDKPLTRKQARAVEQAEIVNNPAFENKINSISSSRDFYDEAVEWGQNWLKDHGL
ncbi:DUF2341 domain-containing protein [Methanosarcina sp. T3]|uniref:DUF2341 domain-containing protein n=1 Tax=Methanosarcina sp. T3 TaxID=3439062 RepID=UPI003F85597B